MIVTKRPGLCLEKVKHNVISIPNRLVGEK